MRECSKSIQRRLGDSNFFRKYFVGKGFDIGGKPDPLFLYKEFFPLMDAVKTWDWEDGDAQLMLGVDDCSLDFVHSSHCLEHLIDPVEGIQNWLRIIREGGYLIVTVPDEDMYEQGVFPSTFNRDHKWTFTIFKANSWSSCSINLLDLVRKLGPTAEIIKIEQLSANYRYKFPRFDQTLTPVAECGIELILRKRPVFEVDAGGRSIEIKDQPERETLLHLNQYMDDMRSMKQRNEVSRPFENDSTL